MALFWQSAFLLSLAVAASVHAEMKLDCRPGFVSLVWTESRSRADPSLFRLGGCAPTSTTARSATFNVEFTDCNFRSMVTGSQLLYTSELTYSSDSKGQTLIQPVVCIFNRPKDYFPITYDPVFETSGQSDLIFHMALMNDDFSGPAESTHFALGSFIPIMARVEQNSHQPLLLLMEECVAATTPQLHPDSNLYNIITNKGCLTDSKRSRSRFEPREMSSEIHLSLQAFRFALGEEVFIHCKLVAWDPEGLDATKKACRFVKGHGWKLLDNPAFSNLCDCCDSSCKSRWTRSTHSGHHGMAQNVVLGPLTITEE
ncbi:zona pellucida sperm-binding protein 3-like isoform X2 [Dunckerocampus dactyliophorus]|uniref:zona pellucida sperm-binding protein 3-like isoform X2 n=1 Tax=Dunckerocampus dactyliophorus TaxID=161453 RepID=UPI0024059F50|nr:zona pellucida sperm-binding protein 3-like isoform X2 [Dunckerocampus dactyliophorus]